MDEEDWSQMSDMESRSRCIVELHFRSSGEEDNDEDDDDDDDDPKLQIDLSRTSEDSFDSRNDNSSNVSINSCRKEPANPEFPNVNPLKSLQKLVHDPYLSCKISTTESGGSQVLGCDRSVVAKSIFTKQQVSIDSLHSTSNSSAINCDVRTRSRAFSTALPFLTPGPKTQNLSQMNSERKESLRMQRVLHKLQVAAKDELNLRKLQELPSEEAKSFAKFRQILEMGISSFPPNDFNSIVQSGTRKNINKIICDDYTMSSKIVTPKTSIRTPPALTIIPRFDNVTISTRKPNCRRSPPPMVPIESIANFRKPLNEDNVVSRLKKLGTDIELERITSKLEKDDDEPMIPITVDCVLSTEQLVTKTENSTNLPSLKPIPTELRDVHITRIQPSPLPPPPPSLIPINCNVTQPFPGPRFVHILPRTASSSLTKSVPLKKKKKRISNKSEYAKLAHALVQPAGASKKEEDVEKNFNRIMCSINKQTSLIDETKVKPEGNDTISVKVEPEASLSSLPDTIKESQTIPTASVTNLSKEGKFEFRTDQAVNNSVMPNGRKLYACAICSAVYHKMYSVKKHFFRSHVNPYFVSEQDALKFSVTIDVTKVENKTGMFRCNTCNNVFNDKEDLKSHLLDHRPTDADGNHQKIDRYRCDGCTLIFRKKKVFLRHLLECERNGTPSEYSIVKEEFSEMKGINEINIVHNDSDKKNLDEKKVENLSVNMLCLFCEVTFKDTNERQKHVLQYHHPKRKQQTCCYCKKRMFNDLGDLLRHICDSHKKKYFGCASCKIRFKTKEELKAHDTESHQTENTNNGKTAEEEIKMPNVTNKTGKTYKCSKCLKVFNSSAELTRHRKSSHRYAKSSIKNNGHSYDAYLSKFSKLAALTSTDHETEFYKSVPQNVRFNLEVHMDGKLDARKAVECKSITRSSFAQMADEKDIENRLTFQDMYGVENVTGPFIRNVSRLHLDTQLKMLKKANLLDSIIDNTNDQQFTRNSCIATELSLTPQKLDPVSLCSELTKNTGKLAFPEIQFSGEWTRHRVYICGVCFTCFSRFWDLDDHRWNKHPNVWNSYYEFPIEQAPGPDWAMKRSLQRIGVLGKLPENKPVNVPPASTCIKCQKVVTPIAEFHKHILECGGDVDWISTMYTPTKKHKKSKPYCGHRRKKTVPKNRMFLRNIPETPIKLPPLSKGKQRAGDTESIRKMIANLPPKRITRRVYSFDDIDSRSRNRYNAQSNVLTRKKKEKIDPKTSARIAKTFEFDNFEIVKTMPKKKKSNTSKSSSSTSDISNGSTSKSSSSTSDVSNGSTVKNSSKKVVIKQEPGTYVNATDVDNSSSTSDTDASMKDTSKSSQKEAPDELKPSIRIKDDDDEEDQPFDLATIEPANQDEPLLPDSKVILAAMKETMRQTDAVIPNQTFYSKKRKRDDTKCKNCGFKIESIGQQLCSLCDEEPKPTENLDVTSAANCTRCGCEIAVDNVESKFHDTICAKCNQVDETVTTESVTTEPVIDKCDDSNNDDALVSCKMCDKQYPKSEFQFCSECLSVLPKMAETFNSTLDGESKNSQIDGSEGEGMLEIKNENCLHCNTPCENGKIICQKCQTTFTSLNSNDVTNEYEEPKCADCGVLKTKEVTLRKFCDKCNNSRKSINGNESQDRRHSGETGVQIVDLKNKEMIGKYVLPPISSLLMSRMSDDEGKNGPLSKNNVILICKGCYGLYCTVSAYKQHCDTCPYRHQEGRKPLLAFAKTTTNKKAAAQVSKTDLNNSAEILEKTFGKHNSKLEQHALENGIENTTESKKSNIGKVAKMKKATEKSIFDTINSVVNKFRASRAAVSPDTGDVKTEIDSDDPPKLSIETSIQINNESVKNNKNAKRRRKPVDTPTREHNMKAVEGEVERQLESQKSKKISPRRQIIFPECDNDKSVNAPPVKKQCKSRVGKPITDTEKQQFGVTKGKKQKQLPIEEIVSSDSKLNKVSDEPLPKKLKSSGNFGNFKSESVRNARLRQNPRSRVLPGTLTAEQTKLTKSTTKKRKAVDDVSGQDAEETVPARLRKKFVYVEPTLRVLRSKSKNETETGIKKSEDDLESGSLLKTGSSKTETVSDERSTINKSKKAKINSENDEVSRVQNTELISKNGEQPISENTTNRKKASVEKKVSANVQNSNVSCNLSDVPFDNKTKTKSTTKKKHEQDTASNKTKVLNNELNFPVTKTEKNARGNTRRENSLNIFEICNPELDENGSLESEEFIERNSLFQQNMTESINEEMDIKDSSDSKTETVNEENDFLEQVPSVPLNSGEHLSVKTPEYMNEVLRYSRGESMVPENFEQNAVHFMLNGSDNVSDLQTDMWYPDTIDYLKEQSFTTIGSILNSVNELLSNPDFVSSAGKALDANNFEELHRIFTMHNFPTDRKDNMTLAQLEDNPPIIIDLDEQSSFITKIKNEPEFQNCFRDSFKDSSENTFICSICKETFTNHNTLITHLSNAHFEITEDTSGKTKKVRNGKVRSSNKNLQNGLKSKLRCNYCQKLVVSKAEMSCHIKEHLKNFAISKIDHALLLKKCMSEKLQRLFMDKALTDFLEPSHHQENRKGLALKILSKLNESRQNQINIFKAAITQVLEIEAQNLPSTSDASNSKGLNNSSSMENTLTNDNADEDGYPCPICSKTFEQTNDRNRHLIMVHAPRQSTHKHLVETVGIKEEEEILNNSHIENGNNSSNPSSTTVLHSYLLNTGMRCMDFTKIFVEQFKSENVLPELSLINTHDQVDEYIRPEMNSNPSTVLISPIKTEMLSSSSTFPNTSFSNAIFSNTSYSNTALPNANHSSTVLPNLVGRPSRKKMSKKEINLPPELVKQKAEEALRELTISRFSRIN